MNGGKWGTSALSIALSVAAPAALAQCESAETLSAARIAEFNTAMMVTSLRCALINIDIKAKYEGFIVHHKKDLQAADDALKRHFQETTVSGRAQYNQFYTQIGNRYGAEPTDSARCALFGAVAGELSQGQSGKEALTKYALALVPSPALSTPNCTGQIPQR